MAPIASGRGPSVATPPASAASSRSNASADAVTPAADAWKAAPTLRSGRNTSGASTSTKSPGARVRSPATSRSPIETATRATERLAANSSVKPERKVIRSTFIVPAR